MRTYGEVMNTTLVDIQRSSATFGDVLRGRALQQPHQLAYTFLRFKGAETASVSYRELDWQARSIAARLQYLGATREPALLLYPPGLEYIAAFFGCLYAGAIPVPAYPPHSARAVPRIQAIVADAQARFVLSTGQIFAHTERWFAEVQDAVSWTWCLTDELAPDEGRNWRESSSAGNDIAFLQYTSGSTATPKGVMVSHRNLMHNAALMCERMKHDEQSTSVSWLPIFHDLGLIAGVLQPLYAGASAILLAPASFLQRPLRWLQAISDYRATTSYAPNFAYDLCISRTTPEERAALDLSCWKHALNGAEPVRSETLDAFSTTFAVSGFRRSSFFPAYGMAETTLVVTAKPYGSQPVVRAVLQTELEQGRVVYAPEECSSTERRVQHVVSCGTPGQGMHIVIVDPVKRELCTPGQVGELWIAGESITEGYWQRPAETAEAFQNYLTTHGDSPFLRTGDLGFMEGDEVFLTGRLKEIIILHGRNYYPQDLERSAEQSHPALRPHCSAAFGVQKGHEEAVVIAIEVDSHYWSDPSQTRVDNESKRAVLVQAIRQAIVEEHNVTVSQVILLRAGSVPKTSSGKIQRRACRAAFLEGSLQERAY